MIDVYVPHRVFETVEEALQAYCDASMGTLIRIGYDGQPLPQERARIEAEVRALVAQYGFSIQGEVLITLRDGRLELIAR